MNPIPETLLHQGLPYSQYRDRVQQNAEIFDEVYRQPAYTDVDLEFLRRLPPLSIVAIAEDWCPDVFHTLPTWARVAEEVTGWALRVFPPDEPRELMNAFLWHGQSRRIPVYAFYDHSDLLQTWWSGRSREAQEAYEAALGGTSWEEADEATRRKVADVFGEGYPARFRRANFEEILALLSAFFHVGR